MYRQPDAGITRPRKSPPNRSSFEGQKSKPAATGAGRMWPQH